MASSARANLVTDGTFYPTPTLWIRIRNVVEVRMDGLPAIFANILSALTIREDEVRRVLGSIFLHGFAHGRAFTDRGSKVRVHIPSSCFCQVPPFIRCPHGSNSR
jgi:hypothetical protein